MKDEGLENMFLQVYKCKLALETKENIVAYGTYLRDSKISIDGTDILVVILYPLQPNALLPFPLSENISTIRDDVYMRFCGLLRL